LVTTGTRLFNAGNFYLVGARGSLKFLSTGLLCGQGRSFLGSRSVQAYSTVYNVCVSFKQMNMLPHGAMYCDEDVKRCRQSLI